MSIFGLFLLTLFCCEKHKKVTQNGAKGTRKDTQNLIKLPQFLFSLDLFGNYRLYQNFPKNLIVKPKLTKSEVLFMFSNELSAKILKIVNERNLTLESLSEAAGLSRKFIGNIANRKQVPTLDSFERICSALQLEPNDLLLSEKSKLPGKSEALEVTQVLKEESKGRHLPICPGCNKPLLRDNQAYCDFCGQRLSWRDFSNANVIFDLPRKL